MKDTKKKNNPSQQRLLTIVGTVVLSLGILIAVFAIGWHYGASNQSAKDKKAIAAATATARNRGYAGGVVAERHVFVGDVTAVSSKQLSVKTTTGQTQVAKLNAQTIVSSAKSPTGSTSDIKVGSHIFVTCTENSDKSLTAQRVLIIH